MAEVRRSESIVISMQSTRALPTPQQT